MIPTIEQPATAGGHLHIKATMTNVRIALLVSLTLTACSNKSNGNGSVDATAAPDAPAIVTIDAASAHIDGSILDGHTTIDAAQSTADAAVDSIDASQDLVDAAIGRIDARPHDDASPRIDARPHDDASPHIDAHTNASIDAHSTVDATAVDAHTTVDATAAIDASPVTNPFGSNEVVNVKSSGVPSNQPAYVTIGQSLSNDGRLVVFSSNATNLSSSCTTSTYGQLYLRDMQTGTITCISVSAAGVCGNGNSSSAAISGDGRFIAFASSATNLVAGDTNGQQDVFLYNVATATSTIVSVAPNGTLGNGYSGNRVAINDDGSLVAFSSYASNLVAADTNGFSDIFLRDISAGVTTLESVSNSNAQGNGDSDAVSLSHNGRFLTFVSNADNFSEFDDGNDPDAFLKDLSDGTLKPLTYDQGYYDQTPASAPPLRVSADGRYIALSFQSIEPSDGTLFCEEDVIDTVENFTEREVDGDEFACATPAISDDGRFHTFLEIENYQGDINQYYYELFVADEASPNITWTLLSATPAGGRARGDSGGAVITPDGKHIIFYSAALDIVAQPAGGPLPSTNVYENPPFAH